MARSSSGGELKPVNTGQIDMIVGRWAGGGAAGNCTRTTGTGIDSVNYNAATGAYKITLTGRYQTLVGYTFTCGSAGTTAAQNVVNFIAYDASAGTITLFVTDVATPTAQDLLTTEELSIVLYLQSEGVYT